MLTLKEKINALFDEDIRQKLYQIITEENDPVYAASAAVRYLHIDLKEWANVIEEEFPD
jgi:hypothetical protein